MRFWKAIGFGVTFFFAGIAVNQFGLMLSARTHVKASHARVGGPLVKAGVKAPDRASAEKPSEPAKVGELGPITSLLAKRESGAPAYHPVVRNLSPTRKILIQLPRSDARTASLEAAGRAGGLLDPAEAGISGTHEGTHGDSTPDTVLYRLIQDDFPTSRQERQAEAPDGSVITTEASLGGGVVYRLFDRNGEIVSETLKTVGADEIMRSYNDQGGIQSFLLRHPDGSTISISFTESGLFRQRQDIHADGGILDVLYDRQGQVASRRETTAEGEGVRTSSGVAS